MAKKLKLSDRLYDTLRQLVEGGEWPEGTRIPPESVLVLKHGVSRPVVREALIRLRADGLIGSRQGSGSFVIGSTSVEPSGYRPIENVADLIQAFEFRYSIECDVAALAALRHTHEDLQAIHHAAHLVAGQPNDDGFGEADFAFHFALARASRNSMYESTLNMLRAQIVFGMRLVGGFAQQSVKTRSETVYEEHEAIVAAIAKRQAADAYQIMGRHLMNSRLRILGFDITADWVRSSSGTQIVPAQVSGNAHEHSSSNARI
ncbi:FadR/GntR family transcriptional regulator [Phyllobacterium endophyticum]|uniref:GntR family transcriptional regulator n=1 Tax=Phyllobacterium endophyticum TaxID=1149773 RepID=A0A2P7AS37_9HYPH|nr:FadR/GntR family transcriptional regulator [Phyllobacterium endophyticum]MBB3236760.1 DNA-binding FadR family transcriptional regulator [Phyllobacterium endophyticum]PSH57038.1 GntR family transcriptional regulator [Phyllobacterium endophyticum]TYR40317.1 FadR family transcriptional regulator [Phyllobacterium endophyticum]